MELSQQDHSRLSDIAKGIEQQGSIHAIASAVAALAAIMLSTCAPAPVAASTPLPAAVDGMERAGEVTQETPAPVAASTPLPAAVDGMARAGEVTQETPAPKALASVELVGLAAFVEDGQAGPTLAESFRQIARELAAQGL